MYYIAFDRKNLPPVYLAGDTYTNPKPYLVNSFDMARGFVSLDLAIEYMDGAAKSGALKPMLTAGNFDNTSTLTVENSNNTIDFSHFTVYAVHPEPVGVYDLMLN